MVSPMAKQAYASSRSLVTHLSDTQQAIVNDFCDRWNQGFENYLNPPLLDQLIPDEAQRKLTTEAIRRSALTLMVLLCDNHVTEEAFKAPLADFATQATNPYKTVNSEKAASIEGKMKETLPLIKALCMGNCSEEMAVWKSIPKLSHADDGASITEPEKIGFKQHIAEIFKGHIETILEKYPAQVAVIRADLRTAQRSTTSGPVIPD